MSDIAISVKNLTKVYHLYDKPVDRLKEALHPKRKLYHHNFYALKDVNFEIRKGETVGIIGRNGAGKSTLLKIITGVLTQTSGEVNVNGKIASLLELGAGFNPEMTGVENIYLNGAIMGFSREEMHFKVDAILEFADIGEFIYQPIKTYSSGMYARLAFSVSVMVEPDILIVDEILSVGDTAFQQKCMVKMKNMIDSGMALIFVSHDPDAVKSLCRYSLFLNKGETVYWGNSKDAVDQYFGFIREEANKEVTKTKHKKETKNLKREKQLDCTLRYGSGTVQVVDFKVLNNKYEEAKAFRYGENIIFKVDYKAFEDVENLSISFLVRDMVGIDLFGTTTFDEGIQLPSYLKFENGTAYIKFLNNLKPGKYGVTITLNIVSNRNYSDNIVLDQIDGIGNFVSSFNLSRPIHYKFFNPVEYEIKGCDKNEI